VLGAPLNELPPKEAFLKAKAAATKALEIDDTLAEAHATLGVVKQRFEWDPEGAAQEFRRAIELNPTYATAHQWYAINFEIIGQPDAALVEAQRAYELDPLSIIINARVGHTYYFARRYDQAIEQYKKTLELDPNFAIAHLRLGWAYTQKGMHREAVEEFLSGNALAGESPETIAALKQAFATSGIRGYWAKSLELELEKTKHRYVSAYEIAIIYARLGEKQQAFDWLDKACEERSSALVYLKVEPSFDSLRQDPHFTDLLRRIHLA
jgi:tetratricopeptide (TPR) repeat protein